MIMELVERTDAVTVLDGLLAAAVVGKGRVAVVSGAVATGKTELLNTFADRVVDLNGLAITATGATSEQDLPLGVMSQLLLDAPLVDDERRRAMNLLYEGAQGLTTGADGISRLDPQIVHSLCTVLIELSRRYPLVVVVDDIDRADQASLVCLAYLARRVRFAPMLALFSRSGQRRPGGPVLEVDGLSRSPHGAHIVLTTLSVAGVQELAAREIAEADAERLAVRWHQLSGGSPLLVGGLIADHLQARADGTVPGDEPVAGGHYAEAVLSGVRRMEPRLQQVARVVAVLPDPGAVGKLTGLDPAEVVQALRALTAAGLVHQGDFRHAAARDAVLSEIEDEERVALHRGAAEIAYHDGASSRVVAEHLLRVGASEEPWAVPVLEDAARQSLRDGRVVPAVGYLKLAWQICADERHRAKIMTTMLRAGWRINPSTSSGYLPELTAAMQNGFLRNGDALVLTKALLWNGQFGEARSVFEHLNATTEEHDQETLTELSITRPLLRSTYPSFLSVLRPPAPHTPDTPVSVTTVAAGYRLEAATAMASVLTRGPSEQIAATVERILHNSRLDEMSLDTVESALFALIYGGHPDRAAPWCDLFIEEAGTRRAPSRLARLAAIRAEISVRLGELPAAVRHARHALEIMPPSSWGVAVGGPLAALIMAATAMGDYDLVREQLDLPVADEMFQTRYGMHYLYARGRYGLAIGQLPFALRDLELCGELAAKWKLDLPGLIPWRADTAEVLLRMGRPGPARKLIDEQLARCGKDMPRVHGMAMRLLAATSELRHRPMLLRQAVDLQAGGDEYELTRALADLTEAYHVLGESRRAGMIARRARAQAEKAQAQPLLKVLSRESSWDEAEAVAQPLNPAGGAAMLSDAERRVAALAAEGYTNREISMKLYITISTVEQHLTRTFRKLNVTRRTDLPANLNLDFSSAS